MPGRTLNSSYTVWDAFLNGSKSDLQGNDAETCWLIGKWVSWCCLLSGASGWKVFIPLCTNSKTLPGLLIGTAWCYSSASPSWMRLLNLRFTGLEQLASWVVRVRFTFIEGILSPYAVLEGASLFFFSFQVDCLWYESKPLRTKVYNSVVISAPPSPMCIYIST